VLRVQSGFAPTPNSINRTDLDLNLFGNLYIMFHYIFFCKCWVNIYIIEAGSGSRFAGENPDLTGSRSANGDSVWEKECGRREKG
jgi:hypothetical protein